LTRNENGRDHPTPSDENCGPPAEDVAVAGREMDYRDVNARVRGLAHEIPGSPSLLPRF
jgi:hypothetical protein